MLGKFRDMAYTILWLNENVKYDTVVFGGSTIASVFLLLLIKIYGVYCYYYDILDLYSEVI